MEFADSFTATLIGQIPDDYLKTVRDALTIFMSEYDVTKKCTDVQVYENPVPKEVTKYLATRKIEGASDQTIDLYGLNLKNFFIAVGKPLTAVTGDDVLCYLANYKVKRNISDSSLDLYRTILHTFFEWCVIEELITKNPCKKVKPIHYWKEKESALTDFQIESIRSNCKTDRDLAMVDFFLSTGCRVSEVIRIKVSDIDFQENKLSVIGKGSKKRTVYINGKCLHSLKQYLDNRKFKSEYLFTSNRAPYNPLTKEAIEKVLKQIGKASDIPKLHPHLFRRTMATNALRRGMELTLVQKILGHENVAVTMRYINISQEDVENAHRRYVA